MIVRINEFMEYSFLCLIKFKCYDTNIPNFVASGNTKLFLM